jgi:hypothetical protein
VCDTVKRHNVQIWGTENPHAKLEQDRDSNKVNVFLAVSSCENYGPFFFGETTVTGINYLEMLQLWLVPQLQEDKEDLIFEQDGTSPYCQFDFHALLSANPPRHWIGSASNNDSPLFPWPPRSPDLTSYDFFIGLHQGSCVRAPYATCFTTAATKGRGGSRCYRP